EVKAAEATAPLQTIPTDRLTSGRAAEHDLVESTEPDSAPKDADHDDPGRLACQAVDGFVTLSREELYERVWSEPMRTIAPEFGLSDVGLAKICKKHRIPRPPI